MLWTGSEQTPEFTRGRIQELEDKERQLSRNAHQHRLPAAAFELLQAASASSAPPPPPASAGQGQQSATQTQGAAPGTWADWYMEEAGPAYRSWVQVCASAPASVCAVLPVAQAFLPLLAV
jgi:hypothetical protein